MKALILVTFFILHSTFILSQTDLDSIMSSNKFNHIEYYKDTQIIHYVENINVFGKKHGKCYSFNRNGVLTGIAEFKRGKKNGEWSVYHVITGSMVGLFYYKNGHRDGHWKSFDSSGKVIAELTYK